jgi:VanZ family protein
MPLHNSARRILAWLPALAWAAFIFVLSSIPSAALPDLGLLSDLLSVGTHVTVFAVLMILVVVAVRGSTRLSDRRVRLLALGLVALYALSDEFHQQFVPGRTPTAFDWFVDMVGASLAWGLLALRENR